LKDQAKPGERKVGVYDRPASADRPRNVSKIVMIIGVVIAVVVAAVYFMRQG